MQEEEEEEDEGGDELDKEAVRVLERIQVGTCIDLEAALKEVTIAENPPLEEEGAGEETQRLSMVVIDSITNLFTGLEADDKSSGKSASQFPVLSSSIS